MFQARVGTTESNTLSESPYLVLVTIVCVCGVDYAALSLGAVGEFYRKYISTLLCYTCVDRFVYGCWLMYL